MRRAFTSCKQKGAISVVIVFILVVVVSSMLVAALNIASSSLSDQNQNRDAIQALFAAESAIDRAIYILKNDTGSCTPVQLIDLAAHTYSNANLKVSFQIVAASNPSAGNCTIKVMGKSNNITRYIDVTLVNSNGGTGAVGGSAFVFNEYFTDINTWVDYPSVLITGTNSTIAIDPANNCMNPPCIDLANAGTGSFNIHTGDISGHIIGYIEKTIAVTIGTPAPITATAQMATAYTKTTLGNNPQITSLDLVDSTGVYATVNLASDNTKRNIPWTISPSPTLSFTAGARYDRVRINYDLKQANKIGSVDVWVDEVSIFIPDIAVPDWNVATWIEN
ncbi:MAG: hypothetical protein OEM38_07320 [Gammaproteobacteria bacterium]|nr:hypothetical protein [Gammaproteobacteria bacterium]